MRSAMSEDEATRRAKEGRLRRSPELRGAARCGAARSRQALATVVSASACARADCSRGALLPRRRRSGRARVPPGQGTAMPNIAQRPNKEQALRPPRQGPGRAPVQAIGGGLRRFPPKGMGAARRTPTERRGDRGVAWVWQACSSRRASKHKA